MTLGENIKKFRKGKNYTQLKLAETTNLSRSYVADLERDRYSPSLETLKTIANALETNICTLIGENENNYGMVTVDSLTEDEIRIMQVALRQYREMKTIAKKEIYKQYNLRKD